MEFMQKQVTTQNRWLEIDGDQGITFVQYDFVYGSQNQKTCSPKKADCQGFYDGDKIYSIEIIDGYGARLSAPGYMDCTEWTVFKTQEQAQNYLNETYDD
jgi:hypothetical protein|tara:strand:- start:163 stop:462 length:300 start_codon:yes stop_codon:yes gene_type:complete